MKRIITISREFGAGGAEVGEKLAERLNYEYYNKELILMSAAKSNLDVMSMINWDEKVPINFGFAQSLFDFYNKPLSDKLFKAQSAVIRRVAEKGSCVILGRNANSILREFDSCLNVFIHADLAWRIERMRPRMEKMTDAQISSHIKSIDKVRAKYCSFYTGEKFGFADNYNISLDTKYFGIDKCVDIIYDLASAE